jgi:hypothetical protein
MMSNLQRRQEIKLMNASQEGKNIATDILPSYASMDCSQIPPDGLLVPPGGGLLD